MPKKYIDEKILQQATDIVQRCRQNKSTMPKKLLPQKRSTAEEVQEAKDAEKLKNWRKALKNMPGQSRLPDSVKEYLDENLPAWRGRHIPTHLDNTDPPLDKAKGIVERYIANGFVFPKHFRILCKEKRRRSSLQQQQRQQLRRQKLGRRQKEGEEKEEATDAANVKQASRDHDRLKYWLAQERQEGHTEGTAQALLYCDQNMPGWREPDVLMGQATDIFEAIVAANMRNCRSSSSPSSSEPTLSKRAFCSWYETFTAGGEGETSSSSSSSSAAPAIGYHEGLAREKGKKRKEK